MPMPKYLALVNVHSGAEVKLDFSHALRLLRLEEQQGRQNFKIAQKGYKFVNNDIVRERSDKASKEAGK